MFSESGKQEQTIADKLYVSIEQLIPGINTEGLQGVATPIGKRSRFDPKYTGKYERMPRPVHDEAKYGMVVDKSTEYMDFVIRASEDKQQRIFFEKFKDQVVVDLAAGAWFTDTYSWISQFGCRGYIPVEPYWADYQLESLDRPYESDKKLVPISIVQDDMLKFLKRLPEGSVSILASGIDAIIFESDYLHAVEKEISRVLDPKGVFIRQSHTHLSPTDLYVLQLEPEPDRQEVMAYTKTIEDAKFFTIDQLKKDLERFESLKVGISPEAGKKYYAPREIIFSAPYVCMQLFGEDTILKLREDYSRAIKGYVHGRRSAEDPVMEIDAAQDYIKKLLALLEEKT